MTIRMRTLHSTAESQPVAARPAAASAPRELVFTQAAPQGFGDRQNSWAWSMYWWRDHLYVGTNRAWQCAERAGMRRAFPLIVKYPPDDPDVVCAPDPTDLPLQAEIWRWSPTTDAWARVYQAPRDVPIPGKRGKLTARALGLRYMAPFTEPDGTQALYVSGVNTRFMFGPIGPPQLLRSVDGVSFAPVPQAKGTLLGDLDVCSFRTIAVYKNRFFVTAGNIQGDGVVLESANPALGNDSFRQITPPGMTVFQMMAYNGYLYLGIRDGKSGYAVVRTDARGAPPYTFTPVVTNGAFLPEPSRGVVSMRVFQDSLFVGTDRPATEVIRINPDDSWELVMGAPRQTPTGWKYPLSGLDAGFNTWLNGHIWRMVEHEGRLYIGTWNMATEFRTTPNAETMLESNYGFDLYATTDGHHFQPVSTTGFGDRFNYGVRSFASTPHGLFVGTANKWYGLQVWRGTPADEALPPQIESAGPVVGSRDLAAPLKLEAEPLETGVLLSWEPVIGAARYRVLRSQVVDQRHQIQRNPFLARIMKLIRMAFAVMPNLYLPPVPDQVWVPGPYSEIGNTDQTLFVDAQAEDGVRYLYHVQAETMDGAASNPSNVVALPLLTPPVTQAVVMERLHRLALQDVEDLAAHFMRIQAALAAGDSAAAATGLQVGAAQIADALDHATNPIALADLQVVWAKWQRRVALCRQGLFPANRL
jgi:hypothetical protein